MKHHENLKFLENMTLKEKASAKVKELDTRMAELNALYENESELKKQKENLSS